MSLSRGQTSVLFQLQHGALIRGNSRGGQTTRKDLDRGVPGQVKLGQGRTCWTGENIDKRIWPGSIKTEGSRQRKIWPVEDLDRRFVDRWKNQWKCFTKAPTSLKETGVMKFSVSAWKFTHLQSADLNRYLCVMLKERGMILFNKGKQEKTWCRTLCKRC